MNETTAIYKLILISKKERKLMICDLHPTTSLYKAGTISSVVHALVNFIGFMLKCCNYRR